jgi:hypothetical protein
MVIIFSKKNIKFRIVSLNKKDLACSLKMEGEYTSETLVFTYQAKWCQNPGDYMNPHSREISDHSHAQYVVLPNTMFHLKTTSEPLLPLSE